MYIILCVVFVTKPFSHYPKGSNRDSATFSFTSTHMDVLMLKNHYEKIQQACSVSFAYADEGIKVGDKLAVVHQTHVVCSRRQYLQESEVNLQTSSRFKFLIVCLEFIFNCFSVIYSKSQHDQGMSFYSIQQYNNHVAVVLALTITWILLVV